MAGFRGPTRPNAPENTPSSDFVPSQVGREAARPSRACPKSRDYAKQVLSGERLADQRRSPVLRRKLLASIAADKGEGHPPTEQSIGDLANRLSAKISIEKSTIDVFPPYPFIVRA